MIRGRVGTITIDLCAFHLDKMEAPCGDNADGWFIIGLKLTNGNIVFVDTPLCVSHAQTMQKFLEKI